VGPSQGGRTRKVCPLRHPAGYRGSGRGRPRGPSRTSRLRAGWRFGPRLYDESWKRPRLRLGRLEAATCMLVPHHSPGRPRLIGGSGRGRRCGIRRRAQGRRGCCSQDCPSRGRTREGHRISGLRLGPASTGSKRHGGGAKSAYARSPRAKVSLGKLEGGGGISTLVDEAVKMPRSRLLKP
jgi:hypothetical protein